MLEPKRTPLYEEHQAAKAKLIDFGGWQMPVQYAGVIEEHQTVRTKAGLAHFGLWLSSTDHLFPNDR